MARIPYPDRAALPESVNALLDRIEPLPNVWRMMALAENSLQPFMRLGNTLLFKAALDPVVRELAILRVGHLCRAGYEVHQHRIVAAQVGASAEKIDATERGEDPVFSDVENLALRATDEMVRGVRMSDATWAALSEHLSPREMAELVLTVGFYQMVSGFLENFDIELEPPGTIGDPLKKAKPPGG